MSLRARIQRLLLVSLSVALISTFFASASTAVNAAGPASATSLTLSLPSAAELDLLPSGTSGVAARVNGQTLHWNYLDGAISLSLGTAIGGHGPVVYGFCTYAVTSALFALGSVGLAAAAAAGGLTVAGIFLAPSFLSQASLVAGSFSALYGLVGAFIC